MNPTNIVPQELNGNTRMGKHLYFVDVAFIAIYFIILSYFEELIAEEVRMFFYITNIVIAITLCIPSFYNPRRKMWKTFAFAFLKDNKVYRNPKVKKEKERE